MDVDDVWEQMKAEGSGPVRKPTGVAIFNSIQAAKPAKKAVPPPRIPGLALKSSGAGVVRDPFSDDSEPLRAAVPSSGTETSTSHREIVAASCDAAPGASSVAVTCEVARPLASFTTVDELQAYYQRYINSIGDESTSVRRKALERLHAGLVQEAPLSPAAEELLRPLFPVLLKPLLKRFADPIEKCRELAIELVLLFMRCILDLGSVLPYIIPALLDRVAPTVGFDIEQNEFVRDTAAADAKRRGRVLPEKAYVLSVVEPSEELRLKLCEVLHALLSRASAIGAGALLMPYYHNLISCSFAAATDTFPDLRVRGCALVAIFATGTPDVFKHYAVGMVKALRTGLDHRHAKVRLATLDAVHACVTCPDKAKCRGAGSAGIHDLVAFQDPNSVPVSAFYKSDARVNFFAKLSMDANGSVRERFYKLLGDWLLHLPDRFDYENFLVPYILSGFGDANPAHASLCFSIIDECGKQYEREKAEELMDKRQYGVDGDTRIVYSGPLPAPFPSRPRLGTRLYVRANVRRILKPLTKELGDWVADTRNKAVILLCTSLVFLEEHVTQDIDDVLLVLMKLIDTEEAAIVAARLVGRFVDPSSYLPFLLPYIKGELYTVSVSSSDALSCARALTVCGAMLRESKPSGILPHFHTLVQALQETSVLTAKSHELRRGYAFMVGALAAVLVGRLGAAASASFERTGRLSDVSADVNLLLLGLLVVQGRERLLDSSASATGASAAAVPAGAGGDSADIAVQWRKELKTPVSAQVACALSNLASACDLTSVPALISMRAGALVKLASESYPATPFWAAQTWQHIVLEEVLALCGPEVAWGLHGAVETVAVTFAAAAPEGVTQHGLHELSALLRFCWSAAAPSEEPCSPFAPTITTLLDVFLACRGVSSCVDGASVWASGTVQHATGVGALPVPSSSLRHDWLATVTCLFEALITSGSAANADILDAVIPRLLPLIAGVQSLSTAADIPVETRAQGVAALASIVRFCGGVSAAPGALPLGVLDKVYVLLLTRLDDANADVRAAVAAVLSQLTFAVGAGVEAASHPAASAVNWTADLLWHLCFRAGSEESTGLLLAAVYDVTSKDVANVKMLLDSKGWMTPAPMSLLTGGGAGGDVAAMEARIVDREPADDVLGHVELLLALPKKG